jgi:hypothetical protein
LPAAHHREILENSGFWRSGKCTGGHVSGDLDPTIRQFLDRTGEKETRESIMARTVILDRNQMD